MTTHLEPRRTWWPFLLLAASACSGKPADSGSGGLAPLSFAPFSNKTNKIDLLLMIDNSSSMADKQALLARAVPDLVGRFVDPMCIDPQSGRVVGKRDPNGICALGEPDFEPVTDIHFGIITSSLGGHGAAGVCDDPNPWKTLPHNDDHGHLVARDTMDRPVPTFNGQGFLNWNPSGTPGQTPDDIVAPFQTMVTGVGQHGCGYEASLEAIYRFLIDPEPYDRLVVEPSPVGSPGVVSPSGTDMVLLQQRSDFLRPDSIVLVVAITDENDCSLVDVGQGFYSILPATGTPPTSVLAHGTTPCLTNPNDPCCYNCFQAQMAGCPDKAADPECAAGSWTRDKDPENLRCHDQKRRYGVDFLYPVARYVTGFTSSTVPDRRFQTVKNPLYSDLTASCRMSGVGCAGERDKRLVFFAGIVGVPWQDIAVDPGDLSRGYLTSEQLTSKGVWNKIVGDPTASPPVPPSDPHMIESVTPRQGLPGPASQAKADPFNGHEWDTSRATPTPNADLQYACTFDLNPPQACMEPGDCDCFVPSGGDPAAAANPLCQNASGEYGTVQTGAKAYPGTRHLQVLKGLGEQAVVASICPVNGADPMAADFGYRPAVNAVVQRLRNALRGRCLPRSIGVDPATGAIPCKVIEAFYPPAGELCACDAALGRHLARPEDLGAEVRYQGTCFCEIDQLAGAALGVCKTDVAPALSTANGWCYVDPSQGSAAECAIVQRCPAPDKRMIRFINEASRPLPGSTRFLGCRESFPVDSRPGDPCAP